MNIGEYKHRITLLTLSKEKDEEGFSVETWMEERKVWARIRQDKRTRVVINEKEIENRTLYFDIRYIPMDLTGYRLSYRGKFYEINSVSDNDFAKKELVLSCSEVV